MASKRRAPSVKVIDKVHVLERGGRLDPEALNLMPAAPGTCEVCATKHPPSLPHNAQSLYYQMRFHAEHGRWPTWKDAIAHSAQDVQEQWEAVLREKGAWTEPEATDG